MSKPTILLTGATGFLGSKILESLLNQNYPVVLLKRSSSDLWRIKHLIKYAKSYNIDINSLKQAFIDQQIDSVIHTAVQYDHNGQLIQRIAESNLMFALKILDTCLKFKTKTFFNIDTILHKNLNDYTLSKKQFVEWLKLKSTQIQIVNLKIDMMYGPKDDTNKLIPWVISELRKDVPEIKLTKGNQKRDFIYIDDVVAACMTILKKAPFSQNFNQFDIGSGQLIKVKTFLELLKKTYETNIGVVKTKLDFGALPYREREKMATEVNNNALIDLGWSPKTNLKTGLNNILK